MKRIALSFAIVAVLAACTSSADASDLSRILRIITGTDHRSHDYAAQRAHAQHLADLERRAIEREYVHHAAHQQPLTNSQHGRLHNSLDRAAQYDELEHRSAHATRAYSPRYIQSYHSTPYGYGNQYRTQQYRAPQYQSYRPYQFDSRVGCSPYDRF